MKNQKKFADDTGKVKNMELIEKTLSSKEIFSGKIIQVHLDEAQLPNGKIASREVIEHPGGVCVAVLTEKDELLFVRQYRYPYHEVVLELPAGKLERGEDPFEACKREQQEETGTTGRDYRNMGWLYPSPGFCNEIIYLYACRAVSFGATNFDADEFLEVQKIGIEKAVELVMSNEIRDAKTQTLVLKIARLLEKNEI